VTSPADRLRALIGDYWKPHVVACAARLGIADALGKETLGAGELATRVGADADAMYRFLRTLASVGLVNDNGDGRFALTGIGACLRKDSPDSLHGMALHVATQLSPAFAQLDQCVRSGSPPPGIKHGTEGFAELDEDTEAAAIFNQAMVDNSRRFATEAARAFDFSGFATTIDVGGGYGAVLAGLLCAVPEARGAVIDLAHAEAGAHRLFEREGVADRARFVTGSFFEPLPEMADCYVLKYILHDWPDAEAEAIVRRVGEAALSSGGAVMVIEKIMPERVAEDPGHAMALYGDMTMMLWNGRERTEPEFRQLLAKGGLQFVQSIELSDNHYLIEARPAT